MTSRSSARLAFATAVLLVFSLSVRAGTRSYEIIQTPSEIPNSISQVFVAPGSYVWCATDQGLVRIGYDSYRHYTAGSASFAIPGNVVNKVDMDYKGRLWVSTDSGLALYDKSTDTFTPMVAEVDGEPRNIIGLSSIEFHGQLLIGGINHLYVYDYDTGNIEVKTHLESDYPFNIQAMYQGRGGYILLYDKEKGFLEYSSDTGEVRPFKVQILDSHCFLMDRYHRFWRSVYGKGLECYDSSCNLVATYTTANSNLSCDVINCIAEKDDEIWVGTEIGGINIIHPDTREVEVLRKELDDPNAFLSNSISSIFCDHSGTVWASMSDGGVIRIKETLARSFFVSPSVSRGRRPVLMPVTAVVPDAASGCVWVGTQSGGMRRYDRVTGELSHCPSTGIMGIVSMAAYDADRIMFMAATKGLYLYSKSTGAITPFKYSDADLDRYMFETTERVNLVNDYEGNILIMADDIYKVEPRSGTVTKVELMRDHADAFHSVNGGDGRDFFCAEHIHRWSAETSTMEVLADFGRRVVNDVAVDGNGCYWVAADDGLYRKSSADAAFARVETTLFDGASMVVCDEQSRVWVGSGESLYVYNPDAGTFRLTDSSDGIFPSAYYPGAVATTPDGHILLGGSNCLTDIDGAEQFQATAAPVVSLVALTVDDVPQRLSTTIHLPRSYQKLSFRVFASEDNILRKKLYRFHIFGGAHDDEIVSEVSEYELRYRQPGKYTVEASCSTADGQWTEPVKVLTFWVYRPWYTSWVFILGVALLLALSLWFVFKYLVTKRKMEMQHDSDKERLRFLLNVSHELKTPLTLIIGPLERLMEEEEPGSKRYQRMVGIRRQALRMRTLILTVLDSHKIEEGAAKLNATPVDINEWVGGVAKDFKDEMEGRNIELKLDMSPSLTQVPIDADKLINVLTNMLINAMKHSPNDTTVTVGTKLLEDGVTMRAFVSDQGAGLGGVDMTKLFGRYYQAMTEKTGTGMGLAYSDSIVRLHGGAMGAFENPGGGSTFYFDIPTKNI